MSSVVMAATKGGTGKTTLSAALAVAAMEDGARVALIDTDPQQSLATWHLARNKPDNPTMIGTDDDEIIERHAAAKRGGFDWCFIDTPPAMITVIEPCVRLADLVVIPIQPSPLDILAVDAIAELCAEFERPLLYVLNRTAPRSAFTEQAAKLLRKGGTVYDGEIGNRQSYAISMLRGLTAPETERTGGVARDEIGALWKAIKRRAGRAR